MTTDQIVRIVLKRVDSIIKNNYESLDEAYDIRREVYSLLNDPIIKSEILALKKESMMRKRGDQIEKLIEERKKERKELLKKISEAKNKYEEQLKEATSERTVQINLNDLKKEQEKEVFSTSELEGFGIKDDKLETNINPEYKISKKDLLRENDKLKKKVQSNKQRINALEKKLLDIENIKSEINKSNKNLEKKETVSKKEDEIKTLDNELNKEETKEKISINENNKIIVKEKPSEKEAKRKVRKTTKENIVFHPDMSNNPEIVKRLEKLEIELIRAMEDHDDRKTRKIEEDIDKIRKEANKNSNKQENKKIIEEKVNKKTEEKKATKDSKKEEKILVETPKEEKVVKEEPKEPKKKTEEKKIPKESKQEEEVLVEAPKEEKVVKEEPKKPKKSEKKATEEPKKEENVLKEKPKKEEKKEEVVEIKEEIPTKINENENNSFEENIKKLSPNLKLGLIKMTFTKNQYNKIIKKYPFLEEIPTIEKKEKIKFSFTKEQKKKLKK